MENKLNYGALEKYCADYADKIADDWFVDKESITGRDILTVTPTKQINLFVLKNLFFAWKEEAERLRSDYFDYKSDAVKSALETLMNELSQNILMDRNSFVPLLKKSAEDALLLVLSPYDFYEREVNNPGRTKVKLNYLHELKKYIKINSSLLEAIIAGFEKEGLKKAFNDEAFRIFQEAFNQFDGQPADVSEYVEELSKVVPLQLGSIYQGSAAPEPSKEENQGAGNTETPEATGSEVDSERKTLNDTFQAVDKTTLADELQFSKIENLKDSLSVNQKFMFINKLFAGDSGIFHEALNRIETLGTKEEAVNLLEIDYQLSQTWDQESEEVVEFMELLDRRFK